MELKHKTNVTNRVASGPLVDLLLQLKVISVLLGRSQLMFNNTITVVLRLLLEDKDAKATAPVNGSADQLLPMLSQLVVLMEKLHGVLTLAHTIAHFHHQLSSLTHSAIHRTLELLPHQCGKNASVRVNMIAHPTVLSPTVLPNIQLLDSVLLQECTQILLSWPNVVLLTTIPVLAPLTQSANGILESNSVQINTLIFTPLLLAQHSLDKTSAIHQPLNLGNNLLHNASITKMLQAVDMPNVSGPMVENSFHQREISAK